MAPQTVTVERPPSASSSAFKKASSDMAKSFDKIVAGTVTSGDFVVTGRVTEIIATDPYTRSSACTFRTASR